MGAGGWLVNPPLRQLGKLSFSAYLWHFAVLEFLDKIQRHGIPWKDKIGLADANNANYLFFVLILAVTLITAGLSAITYNFIESPMIVAGGKIARRWRPVAMAEACEV